MRPSLNFRLRGVGLKDEDVRCGRGSGGEEVEKVKSWLALAVFVLLLAPALVWECALQPGAHAGFVPSGGAFAWAAVG